MGQVRISVNVSISGEKKASGKTVHFTIDGDYPSLDPREMARASVEAFGEAVARYETVKE